MKSYLLFLSCVICLIVGEYASNLADDRRKTKWFNYFLQRHARTPSEDMQPQMSCVHNVEVNRHSIIKTKDSTYNGAKFLKNPPSVQTQNGCISACCATNQCDMAVFGTDAKHSCYLFMCHVHNTDRCLFVDHESYNSISVQRIIPHGSQKQILQSDESRQLEEHEDDLIKLSQVKTDVENDHKKIQPPPKEITTEEPTTIRIVASSTTSTPTTRSDAPKEIVKVVLFEPCLESDICEDSNAVCTNGFCLCRQHYEAQDSVCAAKMIPNTKTVIHHLTSTNVDSKNRYHSTSEPTQGDKSEIHSDTEVTPDSKHEDEYIDKNSEDSTKHIFTDSDVQKPTNSETYDDQTEDKTTKSQQEFQNQEETFKPKNKIEQTNSPSKSTSESSINADIKVGDNTEAKDVVEPDIEDKTDDVEPTKKDKSSTEVNNSKPKDVPKIKNTSLEKVDSIDADILSDVKITESTTSAVVDLRSKPAAAVDDISVLNLKADSSDDEAMLAHSPFDSGSQTAVIALSLGLAITALLLLFVGCRLRLVKKRLRRGRPLNSNEADYLINGMYL